MEKIMTPPDITAFFDEATNTVSYLVVDPATRDAAIIDPVFDYDAASGEVDTASADRILAAVEARDLRVTLVLETHAHADHLSAAPYIKGKTGAAIGIGEHIRDVQKIFRPVFAADDLKTDGSDFDRLFADGERFPIGSLEVEVIHTPGHTPADISYRIGDTLFVGDTLFMPDYGTARDDYAWETTVGAQRDASVHVHDGVSEDDFVAMREARDATLSAPKLLLPSIQVNIRAGRFPEAEANGVRYLKIPVKAKEAIFE
jgi:glyoxylase-like metal-dependent hydrolase (beta-lactamase superfamily II)